MKKFKKEGCEVRQELTAIKENIDAKKEAVRERIRHRNKRTVQIVSVIAILLVLAVATVLSIPLIKAFRSPEGLDALKSKLESYSGIWGVIVFTVIQALQVIIAVIPPVQIVGGLLFGWLWGTVFSFGGTLLGTFCIFMLVSRFGKPLVEAFVDEKHLKRYKFLSDEKKLTAILMVLYLIPGIPKDVISYIVPLTDIRRRDFFLYVMPCRLPAILMSTVLGSNVGSGNVKAVVGVIVAAAVIGLLGFIFKDGIVQKMNRRKKDSSDS
ncbi:MAG: TVP38/TMEM64 family protein [Ruminococcus sp.]|nr:TVP38/TMEM64 family protein [Ruminococcus sp.]